MKKYLKFFNYLITIITAISYIFLLGWLFSHSEYRSLIFSVSVPAVGVVLCSIIRSVINAPRPYEVYEKENSLDKKTTGKSFPSRHVYSIFVVATTIFIFLPILGIALFIMGVALMFLRVYSGVHFVRDVVAGAVLGIATGAITFFII